MNDILFLVKKEFVLNFLCKYIIACVYVIYIFLVRHFQTPKNPFACCLYGYYITYNYVLCFLGETTDIVILIVE